VEAPGDGLQVAFDRGVDVDVPLRRGPDDELVHVDVRSVQEPALVPSGEHGDGVRRAGGAEVRALEGVDGDVDGVAAATDLLADVEHRGLVALAFADDDDPLDVEVFHLLAHGLDGDLVGVLAVSLAHGPGRGYGGALHDPYELQRQLIAPHGHFLA